MGVTGLDGLVRHFAAVADHYAVIGGSACSQWLSEVDMRFRSTMDVDMVLVLDSQDSRFFDLFWRYIEAGGYALQRRIDGTRKLFRFKREAVDEAYPRQIDLLTGLPDVELPPDLRVVHLRAEGPEHDLSAILIDDDYYNLVLGGRRNTRAGLPSVRSDVLLLLKLKAHLNIMKERATKRPVNEHDRDKHRNDVFSLSCLLDGRFDLELTEGIRKDIAAFLENYRPDNAEWNAVRAHLRSFGRPPVEPQVLIDTIRAYYL